MISAMRFTTSSREGPECTQLRSARLRFRAIPGASFRCTSRGRTGFSIRFQPPITKISLVTGTSAKPVSIMRHVSVSRFSSNSHWAKPSPVYSSTPFRFGMRRSRTMPSIVPRCSRTSSSARWADSAVITVHPASTSRNRFKVSRYSSSSTMRTLGLASIVMSRSPCGSSCYPGHVWKPLGIAVGQERHSTNGASPPPGSNTKQASMQPNDLIDNR